MLSAVDSEPWTYINRSRFYLMTLAITYRNAKDASMFLSFENIIASLFCLVHLGYIFYICVYIKNKYQLMML